MNNTHQLMVAVHLYSGDNREYFPMNVHGAVAQSGVTISMAPGSYYPWVMPGNLHNGACGFALADGHSEIHKWRASVLKYPVKLVDWTRTPVSTQDPDFVWILQRTSYPP